MDDFNDIVAEFNRLKASLLQWKHHEECNNKEIYPQSIRDQEKRRFSEILKKHPDINNIMPEYWCATCQELETQKSPL